MKIICFGDSNTYGWDPREFSTNRYDVDWPGLLAEISGHEVLNLGQPGREIYCRDYQYKWFDNYVNRENHDLLIIMLGSNDLLNSSAPRAQVPLERMKIFLEHIEKEQLANDILLLSAPKMRMADSSYDKAVAELGRGLSELAEQKNIAFADPSLWDIPLAFDGIHFTEEGHHIFAQLVNEQIKKMQTDSEE